MLRERALSALILIPLLGLLAYLGQFYWLLTILVVAVLGWREMAQLLQRNHSGVRFWLGLITVLSLIGEAYLSAWLGMDLLRPLLAGLLIITLIFALYSRNELPTTEWGMTLATAVYLGFLLGQFVALRMRTNGLAWLALTLLLCWIADSAAYFVGSTLGRRKLWPRISPKKTWEGLVGGTIAVLIAGLLLGHALVALSPWQGLLLALLVAIADPFGDFAVSLFKRQAHTKDSSQIIPGHGGMLDRLDSLLFVAPIVVYFASIVAGA